LTNNWVGGIPLRDRFSRLFDLAADRGLRWRRCRREGGRMGGAWVWRRRLFAWEEERARECSVLLHNIVLQENTVDRWRWLIDLINGYSVSGTYHFLTMAELSFDWELYADIWHKHVPLKVNVCAWRLIRNRLPIKDNLVRRRVLLIDDNVCVRECGSLETVEHLFLGSDIFTCVWSSVLQWMRISFIAPATVRDHLLQFDHLAGFPRSSHLFFRIIWLACVWVIWKERNNQVFNQKALDSQAISDKVKLLSFSWLKANMSYFVFAYHEWWHHPFSCMVVLV